MNHVHIALEIRNMEFIPSFISLPFARKSDFSFILKFDICGGFSQFLMSMLNSILLVSHLY